MIKPYFNITETPETATIEVYGTIGESWWSEGVTFESVSAQLKEIASAGKKVLVKINSYGGDVNDALAIYEILRSMGDKVTTECYGFCASAATIIAMAGHTRRMSSYGLFLVHKCSSGAWGNENELQAELEAQRKVNEQIVKLYVDVTGTDQQRIEQLMNENNGNGIWLSADEAVEYGFITHTIDHEDKSQKKNFQNMFNLFKNHSPMKKNIVALAMVCAVLATQELEAKDNMALLDDEQLSKINNHIQQLSDEAESNKKAIDEAIKAKDEAVSNANAAQAKADQLQAKIDELQKLIDQKPAQTVEPLGNDPKDEFQEYMANDDFYKNAKAELGK